MIRPSLYKNKNENKYMKCLQESYNQMQRDRTKKSKKYFSDNIAFIYDSYVKDIEINIY